MTAVLTPELLTGADGFLDDDNQYQATAALGREFYDEFGAEKDGHISSQLRNLQQIAVSAPRFADIEDFVKHQMGRKTGAYKEWRRVGVKIIEKLKLLRDEGNKISTDEQERLLLRLYLARGWVRALVGAYMYAKALKEMNQNHG